MDCCLLFLIVIIILVIILVVITKSSNNGSEQFVPDVDINQLDQFYVPASAGVQDMSLDAMLCHPSCCAEQSGPFDGLTAAEIQQSLASNVNGGPYVRSSYTCSGPYGVGCPCITKDAYIKLANRGQASNNTADDIEPTFFVGANLQNNQQMPLAPFVSNADTVFVDNVRMNDNGLRRPPQNVNMVNAYGS